MLPKFASGGMMQGPELAAEAASMQAHYAANLAKVKADEAAGLVADIGQGLTNEERWGEGPYGLTREERDRREAEAKSRPRKSPPV